MIKHSISLGLLLTAGILGQPAVAADYGCPAGAPAERVASDYNRRWLDALETGDPEHLRELYSDNAVIMPPTDETIIGRDPIGEYMATTPSAPPRAPPRAAAASTCPWQGRTRAAAAVP